LKGLRRRYEQFRQAGAQIVTVSADSVGALAKYKENTSAPFVMLSDTDRKVIKEYGIYNPSEHDGVAIPSIFIVDKAGTVRFAHVERTMVRVRNKKLLEEVQKL